MSNVNMPTPVALAGAGLCLLGGYLVGTVAGPSGHAESTAQVQSYDPSTDRLCLTGGAVADDADAKDGVLCGTWRHDAGAQRPEEGCRITRTPFVVRVTGGQRDRPERGDAGCPRSSPSPC